MSGLTTFTPRSSTDRRTAVRAVRADQEARLAFVCDPEFLSRHLLPHLPPPPWSGPWHTRIVQVDGIGAATIAVGGGGRTMAFGKLFTDGTATDVVARLTALRRHGFGPTSKYQVPQPLAFLPDHGLLFTAVAPGRCLAEDIGSDEPRLVEGCRRAGRWLALLHSSPVRVGNPEPLLATSQLAALAYRVAKTVARQPETLETELELLTVLKDLSHEAVEGLQVQCHGQFRPIHVFDDDDLVTVIDLDCSCPGDPARDTAEFVHRLRTATFNLAGSVESAEESTAAFLAAYRESVVDPRYLANLRLHRTRFLVHSLSNKLKSGRLHEGHLAFCRAEIEGLLAEGGGPQVGMSASAFSARSGSSQQTQVIRESLRNQLS